MWEFHSPPQTEVNCQPPSVEKSPPVLICNGIPPVPARLVKRVEEGMYVKMSELLPAHLSSAEFILSDQSASSKPKLCEMNKIMDWIECFGIYIAIMVHSAPYWVADLILYQSLIISTSQKCLVGCWVTYDRRFRLKVSATKRTEWSAYNVTIWNEVFPYSITANYQPRQ